SNDGVSTVPGQIALQRMPWDTKSAATDLVRPITAALVVPYTKRFGTAFTLEQIEDMLMIEPPPRSIMRGRKALIIRYCAVTFSSYEYAHASSSQSRIVPWCT